MSGLLSNAEFWKALSALAWPVVALFLLIRFQPLIAGLLRRENMQIKVGGLEISVQEAAKNAGKDITDLQLRLAKLEQSVSEGSGKTETAKLSDEKIPENSEKIEIGSPISLQESGAEIHKRLLWVDDVPSNNAFLVDGLKQKGVDVVLSRSTGDAVQRLKFEKFSAIITDLGRFENGQERPFAGLELIEKIRSDQLETPVLVFAGSRGMKNREKLMNAGAEDVTDSGVKVMRFVERHLGL